MRRSSFHQFGGWLAATCVALACGQQLLAQEEAEAPEDDPKDEKQAETKEEKVNAYIQQISDAEKKQKLEQMNGAIEDIDRVCQLDEEQRLKLDVAAKGAVDKYLESWREQMDNWVRNRVRTANGDIEQFLGGMGTVRFGNAREWAPERQELWIGSVKSSLTDEQRSLYKEDLDARAAFKHNAMSQAIVADLDRRIKLSAKQRDRLLPLVVVAAEKYWDRLEEWTGNDEQLPLYQMGAILGGVEEDKMKEILSENQQEGWKAFFQTQAGAWNMIERLDKQNEKGGLRLQLGDE